MQGTYQVRHIIIKVPKDDAILSCKRNVSDGWFKSTIEIITILINSKSTFTYAYRESLENICIQGCDMKSLSWFMV